MRRARRKGVVDYILPFLILLGLGIIVILAFQIWSSFQQQGKADVHFYITEGKAKVLPYGQTNWDTAFSGTKFLLGDALKTSPSGRAVLAFFNGTIIRLDNDTALTLKDVGKGSSEEKISVNLDNGSMWLKGQKSPGVMVGNYEVRTAHMVVRANGTVFEVESKGTEIVRVQEGDVDVDILVTTDGKQRVADTLTVGVGQQLELDTAALSAFEANQSPSLREAIDDDFKTTSWYRWNVLEDDDPTDFSKQKLDSSDTEKIVTDTIQTSSQVVDSQEDGSSSQATPVVEDVLSNEDVVTKPVVTNPAQAEATLDKDKFTLTGTVAKGTEKVVVEQVIDGKLDVYTLSKFAAGSTEWSYTVAVNLGNLKKGENVYDIYAVDSKGVKSEAAQVKLVYESAVVEITEPLTLPVVKTFNGLTTSTVETGIVKVEGEIKGAAKVVVNDYELSKFKPGDLTWVYYANENGGNLKPGVNEYSVYGVDEEGNKSQVVTFTITYNKASDVEATPSQETQPQPSEADHGF